MPTLKFKLATSCQKKNPAGDPICVFKLGETENSENGKIIFGVKSK